MTDSDPCFEAKGPGSHPSAADCTALGPIGCDGAMCMVMGEGSENSHCMSPMMADADCKPMTDSDPCFEAKGPGSHPSAADCTALGHIGCDGAMCMVMGEGSENSHCMSPMM